MAPVPAVGTAGLFGSPGLPPDSPEIWPVHAVNNHKAPVASLNLPVFMCHLSDLLPSFFPRCQDGSPESLRGALQCFFPSGSRFSP
jgi:hypothetical protein